GEPTTPQQEVHIDGGQVRALAAEFRGLIEQTPPPFSAKKIAGVPAYKLARKNKPVALKPVQVEIKEFEILSFDNLNSNGSTTNQPQATFRARVASGTYIRSIAHDLGQKLGCGAHLASLRRTAAAEFAIADAHSLSALETARRQGSAESLFVHPRKLVPLLPCVTATEENAAFIRSGRAVNLPEMSRAPQVKVFYGQYDLIAIATRIAGTLFHPGIVFSSEN
ncbi:MAG: tRNA pseudouridine(55) synthase, partial [Terriglobales bacterium]